MRRSFVVAFALFAAILPGCLQTPASPSGSELPSNAVAADVPAPAIDDLAPNAAGLCLAEVVGIVEYDERPCDGNKGVRVKLRKVKRSGEFHEVIMIVTDYGGLRHGPPPKLPDFLRPDTFQKGSNYWIAFASIHDLERHPQRVVNFWQADENAPVEAVLNEAVRADIYRWSPTYDPKTKLVYGRMIDESAQGDEKRWRIQVKRAGNVLWEKVIPGTMSNRYFSWTLDKYAATNFPGKVPPCGKVLVAETAQYLGPKNEFGLPPQMVYVQTGYDPETGVRLTARVTRHQAGEVFLLRREYDPNTGKVEKETSGDSGSSSSP